MNTLITDFFDCLHPIDDKILKDIKENNWLRADGNCTCPVCEEKYREHKNIANYDWLTIICNGSIFKL